MDNGKMIIIILVLLGSCILGAGIYFFMNKNSDDASVTTPPSTTEAAKATAEKTTAATTALFTFSNQTVPYEGPEQSSKTFNLGSINKVSLLNNINYEIITGDQGWGGTHGSQVELAIQRLVNDQLTTIMTTGKLWCTTNAASRTEKYIMNKPPLVPTMVLSGDQVNLILNGLYPGHVPKVKNISVTFT